MDERQQAQIVHAEFCHRIAPLFPALDPAIINAALAELMIEVALRQRPEATRADAMETLAAYFDLGADQARGPAD